MNGERHPYLIPRESRRWDGIADVLRTLGTAIVGVTATITAGITVIGIVAVRPTSPMVDRLTRAWARLILAAAGVPVEVHGTERLDPDQAYVIISNHRSVFDIMCLFAALPLSVRFLAKQELFSIPLFGSILRSLRMVPINRAAADHASINTASGAALRSGQSLVVFAEGTRVTSSDAKAFKKGGFIIAQQHNAPILPIAIVGTAEILPPHGKIVRKGSVAVVIADPIPAKSVAAQSIDELVSHTQRLVWDSEQSWDADRRRSHRRQPQQTIPAADPAVRDGTR